ncbi:MAG: IclR family acetate operon transcriptional repressor [Verrucomicrobiales bacterium]|jgi:IclR family acetate operon transcriptional repressor
MPANTSPSTTSPEIGSPDPEIPRSTGRVLDLLEIVLAEGSCNLTTAATKAHLTPTTALRHLRALEARGYLDRDDAGDFSAGTTVLRMAAVLRSTGELDQLIIAAQPHLDALAVATGESTYLAVSDGRDATYIATAESDRAIRHVGWVGQVVRLDGTAVGEAFAAPDTLVSRTGAVEADITAISLALGHFSKLEVAISVIGPAHRLDETARASVEKHLSSAVEELRQSLGIDDQAVAS